MFPRNRGERMSEDVARSFHEAYERLAPQFGYATRKASAVPWEEVPEPNRSLMVAVAAEVTVDLCARLAEERRVRKLVAEAARDLYERVEMDEAVGICLSDRVPSLRLAAALAESGALDQETT